MNETTLDAARVAPSAASTAKPGRIAPAVRGISIGLIVISLLVIVRELPIEAALGALSGWIEALGPWGPVAFGLIYAVAVVLMIPGSALTLAGGAIFGLFVGTITVSLASNIGAALAFLVARYLARDAVARRVEGNPKFGAIDRAIGEGGWKIVAMLRLSPAVPFNIQNYLYGLTRIQFWPCVLASWVAMLPGTFLYVYLGHVGRAGLEAAAGGEQSRTPAEWAMIVVGLLATVAVTVYVTRLARRAMRRQTELEPADAPPPAGSPASKASETRPNGRSWKTGALAAVATGFLGIALLIQFKPDLLQAAMSRLGGPPPAELLEAYEAKPGGPHVDHSTFDAIVKEHVTEDGYVDYEALSRDTSQLDSYLEQVADAPFEELGRDEKLALLINAYNAFTLKLITEHYPVESIKDIPSAERWDAVRWKLGTHTWSLNQIEHEQIRPKFREPRIHFALVCAAIGCPPLRNEAYAADRLEEQLADQSDYVHHHDRWFVLDADAGTVWLTMLYDWYGGDFEQVAGSVLEFAARDRPDLKALLDANRKPAVRWLDYDWSLNSQENAR